MNSSGMCKIGAIVTVYHPTHGTLEKLLCALESLWRVVIVKNDAPDVDQAWWAERCRRHPDWVLLQMPENGGIAAAINAGVQLLEKEGVQYLWIFDQDSQPRSQALAAMLHTLKQQHASDSETTAAVVPLIHDLHGRQTLPYLVALPQGRIVTAPHRTNAPVLAAIASGMLIPITAWQHIGPMNEALFMDHVDTEWCMRARHLGYHITVCTQAVIDHELGEGQATRLLGVKVVRRVRKPERTYTMIKNGWQIATLPHAPVGWRRYMMRQSLMIAAKALLWGPDRLQQMRAIARAMIDARQPLPGCPHRTL